jgi:hypothetical protein
LPVWLTARVLTTLSVRPAQRRLQSRPLPLPLGILRLQPVLQLLNFGADVCGSVFMLPASLVQGVLRLLDRPLSPLAFLLVGGLLLCSSTLAALLLLLECQCTPAFGGQIGIPI